MKKIRILIIFLMSLGLFACSDDTMLDINKNPNNPTDVASRLIITDIIINTAFSITGADLAWYASVYAEYNVGIYGQMYNAEIRVSEPSSATTYNNQWNSIYSNLLNLKTIIGKCSPGGEEEDNTVILGMAQILSAYNLAILTDLMGDVPWTEALQPGIIWAPVLDKQESIYNVINTFINDGIANLEKPTSIAAIGNQDPMFAGNAGRWIKLAYGLKARYAMRMSHRTPDYDAVIAAANLSFAQKSEEAIFICNGNTIRNPFYLFFTDRDYFGASQSLLDKLTDRNDPREEVFFKEYPGTDELVFAPNGIAPQVQNYFGISALAVPTAPVYVMSYHELEFLKAEAYARKNELDDAKTHLKNAVTTVFTNVGLTAADADEYFGNVVERTFSNQTEALREIMMQKYLGLFEVESIETYNDIRRLRAMGQGDFIPLANTRPFPLRFTYGAEDVTTNFNVRNAYGDGQYVYSENVWWAGGSR